MKESIIIVLAYFTINFLALVYGYLFGEKEYEYLYDDNLDNKKGYRRKTKGKYIQWQSLN